MIYIPSSTKIGSGIQKLIGWNIHKHTAYFYFFKIWGGGYKWILGTRSSYSTARYCSLPVFVLPAATWLRHLHRRLFRSIRRWMHWLGNGLRNRHRPLKSPKATGVKSSLLGYSSVKTNHGSYPQRRPGFDHRSVTGNFWWTMSNNCVDETFHSY
jgi:hypothetical protein